MTPGAPPPVPNPSIGRIVHYFADQAEPGERVTPCAATVFGAGDDWNSDTPLTTKFHVHLRVIGHEGEEHVKLDVPLGIDEARFECWRWPARV